MLSLIDTPLLQTQSAPVRNQSIDLSNKNLLRLDQRCFKAFLAAAETENFTLAAKKACMTQSGVSQQIAKLEMQLDVKLFNRYGKNVLLSPAGKKLTVYIRKYIEFIDHVVSDIQEKHSSLNGEVLFAMPHSCSLCPQFSVFLNRKRQFPELSLNVEFLPCDEIEQRILSHEVDFAIINKKLTNPLLESIPYCHEEYVMVSSDPNITESDISNFSFAGDFIIYPGMRSYLSLWVNHFLPDMKNIETISLNKSNRSNTEAGAIQMVVEGLGLSIFPRRCVQPYLDKKKLFVIDISGQQPLVNGIYISQHKYHNQNKITQKVIEWFLQDKPHCMQSKL
ncbi:MAG: LysR family transcriptional regulator [Gammaproteobacteria bacterium]|nr:LysR family transcriptional regulator [Gammaproteobacteria bacterium]